MLLQVGDGRAYIDRELVIKTYNETKSQTITAKILNIDTHTVHNILINNNINIIPSSESHKKSVAMLDKNTNEILHTFSSIKEAEQFLNINYKSHIGKVCDGQRQTFKGYKWKWL